jgi:hypothetical protein
MKRSYSFLILVFMLNCGCTESQVESPPDAPAIPKGRGGDSSGPSMTIPSGKETQQMNGVPGLPGR